MQTPPPIAEDHSRQYNRPPQNNTLKIVLWISAGCLVLFCVAAGVMAAILMPVFKQAELSAKKTACISNVKMQAVGFLMYSNDWDDRMPPAENWMDSILPYIKSESVYRCPVLKPGQYGYSFNDKLSKFNTPKVASPADYVMIFETSDLQRSVFGHTDTLPKPPRHGRNNMAFADGHAKAQQEAWIPTMDQDPTKAILNRYGR